MVAIYLTLQKTQLKFPNLKAVYTIPTLYSVKSRSGNKRESGRKNSLRVQLHIAGAGKVCVYEA
jgi:hypothetical protein